MAKPSQANVAHSQTDHTRDAKQKKGHLAAFGSGPSRHLAHFGCGLRVCGLRAPSESHSHSLLLLFMQPTLGRRAAGTSSHDLLTLQKDPFNQPKFGTYGRHLTIMGRQAVCWSYSTACKVKKCFVLKFEHVSAGIHSFTDCFLGPTDPALTAGLDCEIRTRSGPNTWALTATPHSNPSPFASHRASTGSWYVGPSALCTSRKSQLRRSPPLGAWSGWVELLAI